MTERKIKVAYVINSVLVAGAETTLFETASHLGRERFSPVVYVLGDYGDGRPTLVPRFAQANIPLIFLSPGKKLGVISALTSLRRMFRKERPDVIHAHLPDAVIASGIAAILLRIPFIIHEHQTHKFHSWKIRLAYRFLRLFAALTITYAETLEAELFGTTHVLRDPPERLAYSSYTVHNGIDVDRVKTTLSSLDRDRKRHECGFTKDDVIITSVARFVEWKGHQLLVEAFASVADHIPNARLFILGNGPLLEPLRARARELHLENRISLPGARNDIYEILGSSDIFSLAFVYPDGVDAEAIGIAGFEAMAFGLPVVIGDYAGARTYLGDNERGMIVAPRDRDALAQALVRLVNDKQYRQQLGDAARVFVARELDWNVLIKVYERIYTLIVNL
ncbi:MAG TPA: glycosyltransferase [Candidatus Paceibacterota bacterium]|nr:glycosyltransferase [Candidatus Paceibacterota bacterium]